MYNNQWHLLFAGIFKKRRIYIGLLNQAENISKLMLILSMQVAILIIRAFLDFKTYNGFHYKCKLKRRMRTMNSFTHFIAWREIHRTRCWYTVYRSMPTQLPYLTHSSQIEITRYTTMRFLSRLLSKNQPRLTLLEFVILG